MKHIPLATPHMCGKELDYVHHAFETNWVAPLGENVNEFENEIARYLNVKSAAALSSGTGAIHLAIKLAGVKRGDIVFCSSMTFSASCNPIAYEHAVPVFIDCDYETWNMSPKALKKAFEKYPSCKCVVCVNLYGIPANYDEICAICKEYGAILVEDAAESLGSSYKGRMTGTFGKYGILSFNGNKIITTSGGGMLVSNDEEGIKKARFWATQSRENELWYQHKDIGYNYRMSNICAGIGRGQLTALQDRINKKNDIYNTYKEGFKGLPLEMMPNPNTGVSNKWLSCIILNKDCELNNIDIILKLKELDIETRPIWKPMHMQPVFDGCDYFAHGDISVCEDIFARGLCLPSDTKMTKEEQQYVIDCIRGLFKNV